MGDSEVVFKGYVILDERGEPFLWTPSDTIIVYASSYTAEKSRLNMFSWNREAELYTIIEVTINK